MARRQHPRSRETVGDGTAGSGPRASWRSVAAPRSSRAGGGSASTRWSSSATAEGQVAWGYGKANEVPPAVEKGVKDAHKQMNRVNLKGSTIPHRVIGKFGAARVVMLPASPGTGVIAGGAVRAVVQAAGITDILTKSYGSTNKLNLVKAAIDGLTQLRTKEEVARLRGVTL